jgi:hypothetical protein
MIKKYTIQTPCIKKAIEQPLDLNRQRRDLQSVALPVVLSLK